jgi:hypothetical protein
MALGSATEPHLLRRDSVESIRGTCSPLAGVHVERGTASAHDQAGEQLIEPGVDDLVVGGGRVGRPDAQSPSPELDVVVPVGPDRPWAPAAPSEAPAEVIQVVFEVRR